MEKLAAFGLTLSLCVSAVMGCSKQEPPKGVIPEHQLDALKKANEVEGLLQKTEQNRKEILE